MSKKNRWTRSNVAAPRTETNSAPRPAAVALPEWALTGLAATSAEICVFGGKEGHLTVAHGNLHGVPFQGSLGRNGPDTPRFTRESLSAWVKANGLTLLTKESFTTQQGGEEATLYKFVTVDDSGL